MFKWLTNLFTLSSTTAKTVTQPINSSEVSSLEKATPANSKKPKKQTTPRKQKQSTN